MPGAGGLVEINYVDNVAPKDGSEFAIIQHGLIFRPMFDPREVRYKVEHFRWLGSVTPIVVIGVFRKDAPAQTVDQLFTHETLVGLAGGTTVYLPVAINHILHTKMKLVPGYRGTSDIALAMQRREVFGIVGLGLDSFRHEIAGKEAENYRILFQMGVKRAAALPDVPLIQEFAKSELDKQALEAIFASFSIGRVFMTSNIPDDRYNALRAAFEKTVKEPAFLAQAQKQKSEVSFVSHDDIGAIIRKVYGEPAEVVKQASTAMTAQ
jgi:tripartite-type tricarboxylate transporter receptor subunit TctC